MNLTYAVLLSLTNRLVLFFLFCYCCCCCCCSSSSSSFVLRSASLYTFISPTLLLRILILHLLLRLLLFLHFSIWGYTKWRLCLFLAYPFSYSPLLLLLLRLLLRLLLLLHFFYIPHRLKIPFTSDILFPYKTS